MVELKSYMTQVTTILGSSGIVYIIAQVMMGAMTWQNGLASAVPAIMAIVWPESKGATANDVGKVVSDVLAVTTVSTKPEVK